MRDHKTLVFRKYLLSLRMFRDQKTFGKRCVRAILVPLEVCYTVFTATYFETYIKLGHFFRTEKNVNTADRRIILKALYEYIKHV